MSAPTPYRPGPLARSTHASRSTYTPVSGPSDPRPFLHALNPLGRTNHGYVQVNQSLVEEEEAENEERDIEAGHATRTSTFSSKSHDKRKLTQGEDVELLRPNIRQEDHSLQDSDDEEVPQRFMIEATHKPPSPLTAAHSSKGKGRLQPLYSTSARSVPQDTVHTHDILPPRPSELDGDVAAQTLPQHHSSPKPMRGLDARERALWNWVNVYNLDAFLQEVYAYYEGKGIYPIALTRGLNLLSVNISFLF